MQYSKFVIKNYRAIKGPLEIDLKNKIVKKIKDLIDLIINAITKKDKWKL